MTCWPTECCQVNRDNKVISYKRISHILKKTLWLSQYSCTVPLWKFYGRWKTLRNKMFFFYKETPKKILHIKSINCGPDVFRAFTFCLFFAYSWSVTWEFVSLFFFFDITKYWDYKMILNNIK